MGKAIRIARDFYNISQAEIEKKFSINLLPIEQGKRLHTPDELADKIAQHLRADSAADLIRKADLIVMIKENSKDAIGYNELQAEYLKKRGAAIRLVRLSENKRQDQIAEAAGISSIMVLHVEMGEPKKYRFGQDAVDKIIAALGLESELALFQRSRELQANGFIDEGQRAKKNDAKIQKPRIRKKEALAEHESKPLPAPSIPTAITSSQYAINTPITATTEPPLEALVAELEVKSSPPKAPVPPPVKAAIALPVLPESTAEMGQVIDAILRFAQAKNITPDKIPAVNYLPWSHLKILADQKKCDRANKTLAQQALGKIMSFLQYNDITLMITEAAELPPVVAASETPIVQPPKSKTSFAAEAPNLNSPRTEAAKLKPVFEIDQAVFGKLLKIIRKSRKLEDYEIPGIYGNQLKQIENGEWPAKADGWELLPEPVMHYLDALQITKPKGVQDLPRVFEDVVKTAMRENSAEVSKVLREMNVKSHAKKSTDSLEK